MACDVAGAAAGVISRLGPGGYLGQVLQAGQQGVVVGQQGGQFFAGLHGVVQAAFCQGGPVRCQARQGWPRVSAG